jgi:hypothetical protein
MMAAAQAEAAATQPSLPPRPGSPACAARSGRQRDSSLVLGNNLISSHRQTTEPAMSVHTAGYEPTTQKMTLLKLESYIVGVGTAPRAGS